MGMFDYVKSSYDLGEDFACSCQTKDIENCLGGTMTQYWISPSGQLFMIDYSHTADFVEDPNPNPKFPFMKFHWVPNGAHGRVSPIYLTKYVTIYPEKWDGHWKERPEVMIHFKDGVVEDLIYNPT